MATIYNSQLSQELTDGAKIQVSKDKIPTELAEKVIPVMEVNPKLFRRINVIKAGIALNVTGTGVYTTPTDKDFYLCGAQLSLIKDVTSTSTFTYLSCTDEYGALQTLLKIVSLSLTPQIDGCTADFTIPIKLKRGSVIGINNFTNVANITSHACIWGYTVDNNA